ncbi:hypothetical protein GOV14_02880 [Candidatus Pacearchaeota archaeon]|nr:hypothetical protein [Candidatus Pacearchaeota archaeon]
MIKDLRAHHVESAKYLHTHSFEDAVTALVTFEYIKTPSDSFVQAIADLKYQFDNPNQQFRIKIDEFDFICEQCPHIKNNACTSKNATNLIGRAFFGRVEMDLGDKRIAEKYGLEEEKIYSVQELRQKAGF